MKVNMIVCVAENNLIGDKNPTGNGLLWHSKDKLKFFKEKTIGNVVLFGENTAKFVPIELMKKDRDVEILSYGINIDNILKKYNNREIFVCGGYSIYKYFLENYKLDKIYISKLKPNIEICTPNDPLYFTKVEEFGYSVAEIKEYQDFIAYTYKK